jgi:hypothetical protein
MRYLLWLFLPAVLLYWTSPAWAADLTKIDRTIAKEPAYKGAPKYCLLVFGPEAQYRDWLVVDDEAVYVDRKGTGDLSSPENRVPWINKAWCKPIDLSFDGGKVQYKGLNVNKRLFRKEAMWTIEVNGKYQQRVSRDGQERFAPADNPQDAPIIHFDGPLAMEPVSYCDGQTPILTRGSKNNEIAASVGTAGLGKGTFAYVIPPTGVSALKPLAEVEFAHLDPKGKPFKLSIRLAVPEDVCLSFFAPIQVPDNAAGNKAKVTLSFADWKEGGVAARTFEVAINEPKANK